MMLMVAPFRRFNGNPLSSINTTTIAGEDVMSQVSTFVMFRGEAQQAIDLYSRVLRASSCRCSITTRRRTAGD